MNPAGASRKSLTSSPRVREHPRLQADMQSPEIDFRFTPNNRHSEDHAGLPFLTHSGHCGSPSGGIQVARQIRCVICAGRSAPSECEIVTGPGFSSPNRPDQERATAYRDSSGPNSQPDMSRSRLSISGLPSHITNLADHINLI